ncbi:hypothetical protein DNTS_018408 [Danionella cerebrum]|uniref:EF-hand domain-containing protein n=1 Tax=Danionella cerebrum TaxID=2873325 RepID=A0A553REB4_9TELE|nr:hypothetical protein DNTS_018408 [Danionella translucida]
MSISEEFEADGQQHLWNPDEPSTPRSSGPVPLSELEESLQNACHQLALPTHGTATLQQLQALCQLIGIELSEEMLQCVDESSIDVQEFISCIVNHSKPPTPSASSPYRQLKRIHSSQFDESRRRISCALSSTIGLRVFSDLDDGSGHAPVENVLYRWMEEGVHNSTEILQALDFNLEGQVNLSDLTVALENELLSTKNSIHQVALVSFKAEIRHLLECVELERCEKEKIRLDLDKAEKLKSQLASEVDDHHAAIERNNELNLRKLEQEYKDGMLALRSELSKEMELVQLQANQQREELEQETSKMRDDETFLREHLTITVKENGRLESELIETTEKLVETENLLNKLQKNLDGVLKEKFGDLDPESAAFYQHEDCLRQLHKHYEEQCRELQDRIDELEAQMKEYQNSGNTPTMCPGLSLSDEMAGSHLDSGSQMLNMSLETEMLLEQQQREIEDVRTMVDEGKRCAEEEQRRLSLQHQEEVQGLMEEMGRERKRANNLEQELSSLLTLHQQELQSLMQEAHDSKSRAKELEVMVEVLQEEKTAFEDEIKVLKLVELKHQEALERSMMEQRERLLEEKDKDEKRLMEQWKEEREMLNAQIVEMQKITEQEYFNLEKRLCVEFEERRKEELETELCEKEKKLQEEWEKERHKLEEISNEALQAILDEHSEKEKRLKQRWEEERASLDNKHHTLLLQRLQEEREHFLEMQEEKQSIMMEHWEREKAQLEKQHEQALRACLEQERQRLEVEREEQVRKMQLTMVEEQCRMEEVHREAVQELSTKHSHERENLSSLLEKLRTDVAEQSSEVGRLAKENLILRKKISTIAACQAREEIRSSTQTTEPRRLGQQLDEEHYLFQQNADHVLRQALQEVIRLHNNSANEKNGMCERDDISSRAEKEILKSELNQCLEKTMSLDSSLKTLTHQNSLLKSDLHLTRQERDSLKQDVITLHKQLQSANEKLLEVSVVSAGHHQGRRVWAELSGLMEAEHTSLVEENQQIKRQIAELSLELQSSKEQIRRLEALNVKQRGLVKTADQEKSLLKREMEALHSQLLSTQNKAQLTAFLPASSLQFPGEQMVQNHGDGPDFNIQEREAALLQMEERMREVEVTLRNLKLLLQDKVSQLKEQLIRNSESDVLIKDLYVENAQLLKALEKTEQRQKVTEKKNFLLEEKISSLNKIVRDLGPSPITTVPYHFTRS